MLAVGSLWLCFLVCPHVYISLFNAMFQLNSVKYIAKPLSTFHQINAYEEDGLLIMDLCASDDGKAISNYYVQNLRKSGEALDEVSVSC